MDEVPMLALRAIAAGFRATFMTKADLMVENLALHRLLQRYIHYYHRSRTHLSLE